jgi:hypothetical protein
MGSTSITADRYADSGRPKRCGANSPGRFCFLAALAVGLALAAAPVAQAAGPPQIDAAWVTDVTATSASLHATVNPAGLATAYRFEYLTEAKYQANPPSERFAGASRAPSFGEASLGSTETDQPASQHLVSLTPNTSYRYRILATNSSSPPGGTAGLPLTFATQANASFAAEGCPNSQLRFEDSSLSLPDCRAWELASPADKNGGAIQSFGGNSGGGVLQAAENGEAATYSSSASFAGGQGAPTASQYISSRGEAGWVTENITQPTLSGAYPNSNSGVPYQLFSTDLARGLLLDGRRCAQGGECPRSYSLRQSAGGALTTSAAEPDLRFAGSSPDLGQVILFTCAALTTDATEVLSGGGGCEPSAPNLYRWSGGVLTLINLLPGEVHGTPGARLAAQGGAVSADGSRVYFTDGEDSAIYLREAGGPTKLVPETVGGGASFQTASADGSLAFFIKGAHLFRYSAAANTATDLIPSGGVVGVLGAAADGSSVYYLTAAGLFLWQAPSTTTEIAAGASPAFAGDYPPTTGTARVTPDGAHLAFLSTARLTGFDNTDQLTGQPDSEAFLYSAGGGGGALACVSCNPTNERPVGPSTIPGSIPNGNLAEDPSATDVYKPRDLSIDGNRLFFDSRDQIVPEDASAAQDIYEWEAQGSGTCARPGGCLDLISSGKSSEASSFIDASAGGSDAFFLTGDSLVPWADPGSADLYDAREGGGFPEPAAAIPCDGDACQALPSPSEDPAPGTLVAGQPNPPVGFPKHACPKAKRRVVRHGKTRCVPKHHQKRQGSK